MDINLSRRLCMSRCWMRASAVESAGQYPKFRLILGVVVVTIWHEATFANAIGCAALQLPQRSGYQRADCHVGRRCCKS